MIRHLSNILVCLILICSFYVKATTLSCESLFFESEEEIIERHMQDLRSTGFTYAPAKGAPVVHLQLSTTSHPLSAWKIEQINTPFGQSYYSFDVGMHNLIGDVKDYETAHRKHLLDPNMYKIHFFIEDVGERKISHDTLNNWRWAFHDATLDVYANHPHKAKYLNDRALRELEDQNEFNEMSDVFGVIEQPTQKILSLTREDIKKLTATTIQLSYHSQHVTYISKFLPFMNSGLRKTKPKILPFMERMFKTVPVFPHDNLPPFEYIKLMLEESKKPDTNDPINIKMSPTVDISEFMQRFQRDFGHLKVAELNRWSNPLSQIPDSIRDYLVLKAFERAEAQGVQVLFASSDRATKKLLTKNYGFEFKPYAEFRRTYYDTTTGEIIPDHPAEQEFVLKLVIGSEDYIKVKNRLIDSVKELQIQSTTMTKMDQLIDSP